MSKWCGDENCLQCADKEPDPYVHLPREEYVALREQNRVLRQFASTVVERWRAQTNVKEGVSFRMAMKALEAALTATSQPAQEQCSYCKRPLTDNHSFSYGVPGVPRVYKCDRADCTKPATSQEGQHGSR